MLLKHPTKPQISWFRIVLQAAASAAMLILVAQFLLMIILLVCRVAPTLHSLQEDGPIDRSILPNRTFMRLQDIPPDLTRSVLYMEDPGFYEHSGIDPFLVQRAISLNFRKQALVYGGSGISQQLARTLFLNTDKNLGRKLLELSTSLVLERSLSKKRILELYLNYIPLGRGVYGFPDAALSFYHTSLKNLTIPQKITLLTIMPSPFKYSPTTWNKSPTLRQRNQMILQFYRGLASPFSGIFKAELP